MPSVSAAAAPSMSYARSLAPSSASSSTAGSLHSALKACGTRSVAARRAAAPKVSSDSS